MPDMRRGDGGDERVVLDLRFIGLAAREGRRGRRRTSRKPFVRAVIWPACGGGEVCRRTWPVATAAG